MRYLKAEILIIIAIFLILQMNPKSIFANTGVDETEDLKKEITSLKERLSALEVRLEQSEIKTANIEKEKSSYESGIPGTVTSFAREIEVHGFADTSYLLNSNTPVAPNPRTSNLRIFDTDAEGFMLNMTQLNIEKPISKQSPLGFRADFDYGQDAKLIHSNGLGNAGDEFDLQQAYAQFYIPYSFPGMSALSFKAGKFATLQGAEVIESVNNWNFSRSYLFGYAIPFTHTGLRAYYKPFENVPVESYIGIVNGWDQVVDVNKAKTIEGQVVVTPFERLSFSVGGMSGPERADSNKDFRNLVDVVATYKATDRLTFKANYDYGWEANAASVAAGNTDGKNASWDGVAGYARYELFDWWAVAGRGEFFHDRDGVRTGVLTSATMPLADLELWEYTLTSEFKIFKNLIARLEYRFDKAGDEVFLKNKTTADYQNTVSAELIAKF
jgi:hypothetical protein